MVALIFLPLAAFSPAFEARDNFSKGLFLFESLEQQFWCEGRETPDNIFGLDSFESPCL